METTTRQLNICEVLFFDRTSQLFSFLKLHKALDKLELFKKTPMRTIPCDNTGYVLLVNGEIAGAASIYDELDGTIFNELFEITNDFQGHGWCRYLYEFIKRDLEPDAVHGFATDDYTQSLWEHLGQVCIDQNTHEMVELVSDTYENLEEYLEER